MRRTLREGSQCPAAKQVGEPARVTKTTRIVACGVFRPALKHLKVRRHYPHVSLSFLPSRLHLCPQELERRLTKRLRAAQRHGERTVCLYGRCFPEIEEVCERFGSPRVAGEHCYEMLLGPERYRHILEESAGTYFLECELLQHFEHYCSRPLELEDEEIRKLMFQHYQKLIYLKQPRDKGLEAKAGEVARFLNLTLEVGETDYSYLNKALRQLI